MTSVAMKRGMGLAMSVFLVCAVGTALGQQGEHNFEFSTAPPQPAVHAGPQPRGVCADFTLTQNLDPFTLTAAGHVACLSAAGVAQNGFARTYDLSAGVTSGSDVLIKCVDFGINRAGQPYSVNINIYVDTNGGGPVGPGIDLVLMGTTAVPITADGVPTFYTATFVPPVTILADSQMVVELEFPDDQANPLCAGNACDTFPGANNLGSTIPNSSYLRSAACGLPNFTPVANIGFPDTHYLQRIDLDLVIPATGACCADQGGGNFNCTTESLTNCQGLGGVWTVNETCGNLMPPCGTGACCLEDGSCVDDQSESACMAAPMFRRFLFNETCAVGNCPAPICPINIPPAANSENEACGTDVNGGCNLAVPAFEMINCGDIVTGEIFIDAAGVRDTDWYQITLPGAGGRLQVSGTAQFPLQLLVIDGNTGCPVGGAVTILNTALANSCEEATLVTDNLFGAGIYWIHVTVQRGLGVVDCNNTGDFGKDYFVEVQCLDAIGGCCNLQCPFTCVQETLTNCTALGWAFLGEGIQCVLGQCGIPDPSDCCAGDMNGDGRRTGADIQAYVAGFIAAPTCNLNGADFCLLNMDFDGDLDADDVAGFVQELLDPEPCPTAGPANDSCQNATDIGDIVLEPWDNLNATTDGPDETINCGGPVLDDVWYCYTATCTGQVTVSTCNSNFNNSVAVYDSDPNCGGCPTIAESAIACNTVGCVGTDQIATFQGVQGVKYFIRLGGNDPNAPQGTGVLTVGCS